MNKIPIPVFFKKPRDLLNFNQNKPISEFCTPQGFVEMDLNPGVKKVSKDIGKLISNCNESFKVVETLCEEIGHHVCTAGELTEKLSKYLNKINKDYSSFFDHNKSSPVSEMGQVYDSASSMLAEIGNQMKKSSIVFSGDLQRMFKFSSYENEGLQHLIELRNSFTETYEEAKINLERKKAALVEQKDLRRWGIDPTKLKLSPQDLLNNPSLGKKYMLPQVFQY